MTTKTLYKRNSPLCRARPQVQGEEAYTILKQKVKTAGFGVLYAGAFANFAASWAGNYPWFAVFNYLQVGLA